YESQADPFQLVSMHAREMAGMRCRPNFQNAYAANGECGGQQPPVIVLDTTAALLHRISPGGLLGRSGRIISGDLQKLGPPVLGRKLQIFSPALFVVIR